MPEALLLRLREARCIEIDATPEARLAYLLRDYACLGDDRPALADKLGSSRDCSPTRRWRAGSMGP